jgi:hypothetical protein
VGVYFKEKIVPPLYAAENAAERASEQAKQDDSLLAMPREYLSAFPAI